MHSWPLPDFSLLVLFLNNFEPVQSFPFCRGISLSEGTTTRAPLCPDARRRRTHHRNTRAHKKAETRCSSGCRLPWSSLRSRCHARPPKRKSSRSRRSLPTARREPRVARRSERDGTSNYGSWRRCCLHPWVFNHASMPATARSSVEERNSTRPHLPHPSLHTSSTRCHCSLRNSRSRRITSLSHGRSCPSPSQWCPDASSSRFRFRRRRETPITLNIAFVTRGENPFPAITCPTLNFASGSLSCAYPMAQRFSAGVHTRLSVGCIAHPCIPSGLDFFVGDLAGLSNRCRRYTRFPMAVKFSSKRSTPCTFRMDCGIVA